MSDKAMSVTVLNWIDINERKPEYGRPCFAANNSVVYSDSVYYDKEKWYDSLDYDEQCRLTDNFTHWCYADNLKLVPYVE